MGGKVRSSEKITRALTISIEPEGAICKFKKGILESVEAGQDGEIKLGGIT